MAQSYSETYRPVTLYLLWRGMLCQLQIPRVWEVRCRCFTEQGVAMLSSVLKSKRAAQVNIAIMRAFVRLRELMMTHKDLGAPFG